MRRLVLVHGRAQQGKKAEELKAEWMRALHEGLRAAGIDDEAPDERVAFPYYGDTLDRLVRAPDQTAPDVIVAGIADTTGPEREFIGSVVAEVAAVVGLTEEQVRAEASADVVEAGPLNWPWVLAALRAMERLPGAGPTSIALATHDVWMYLTHPGVGRVIDNGVRAAMTTEETVVVSHSLGTVVTYNLLTREAATQDWRLPALITLGSPLGIREIVKRLTPLRYAAGTDAWFNARDPQDTVALHPLDSTYFPVSPEIENYSGVHNPTANQHGISGYLSDPVVARRIWDALTDSEVRGPGIAGPTR